MGSIPNISFNTQLCWHNSERMLHMQGCHLWGFKPKPQQHSQWIQMSPQYYCKSMGSTQYSFPSKQLSSQLLIQMPTVWPHHVRIGNCSRWFFWGTLASPKKIKNKFETFAKAKKDFFYSELWSNRCLANCPIRKALPSQASQLSPIPMTQVSWFFKLPFATWNPSSHTQESTAMQFPKQQMSPNLILKLSVDPVFLFWGKNCHFCLWWKFEGVLFMHLFHTINHIRYYSAQHVTSWGHPLASAREIKAITSRGLKRASESWHHHFSNWIEGTLGLGF